MFFARAYYCAGIYQAPIFAISPSDRFGSDTDPALTGQYRSLNDSFGTQHDGLRDHETKRPRGFHIDHELEPRRLLDRNVRRSSTFKNLVYEIGRSAKQIEDTNSVADHASRFAEINVA